MITITTRPFTEEEKRELLAQIPSASNAPQHVILMFLGLTMVSLIPFLLLDKLFDIPANVQIVLCLLIVLGLAWYSYQKWWKPNIDFGEKKKQETELKNTFAEVWRVKTNRAWEREDAEDFGPAFYLEVDEKQGAKTLFLSGQYLYEQDFPNTEFELIKKAGTKEIIRLVALGKYFKPEKALPPFDKQTLKSGNHPYDGDLLDKSLDEII